MFGAPLAEADFFREQAKQSTAESVKSVESQTSAEVVVAVRRRSGEYRPAAYHFGFFTSALVVLYLLVTPELVSVGAIALDAVLGFGLGLLLALNVSPLLRLLVRSKALDGNVAAAARVAFFDLGISRTARRTGILVYVSTFERRCLVLTDVGIDVAALGPAWAECCAALSRTVAARDLPAFERALQGLGPILGAVMPRAHDDLNELSDEVR
jgi:putative membrane protein